MSEPEASPSPDAEAPAPHVGAKETPSTSAAIEILPLRPVQRPTAADIDDVVEKAAELAKHGDMEAARVVWRFARWHCLPIVVDIGEVRTAEQIAEAQSQVLKLTFAGHLTPLDGARLSGMIENRRRTLHTLEQQRQLDDMIEFARQHAPGKRGRR